MVGDLLCTEGIGGTQCDSGMDPGPKASVLGDISLLPI